MTTPIERPFTTSQAHSHQQVALDPLSDIPKDQLEGKVTNGQNAPTPTAKSTTHLPPSPSLDISNLELRTALLNLARQPAPRTHKRHRGIKEPDTFSRGDADDLRAFIFQCQIYFRACEEEFSEDTKKIFFAISYLRGIALDYFEPYINEPDPLQDFDFLEDWVAFVQKLSNVFGSYTPEDDDKDAIVTIPFPPDGKAVTYFIQFVKYQNRIRWGDHSLHKVIKDTIPVRISEELWYSKEDLSTFKGVINRLCGLLTNHHG